MGLFCLVLLYFATFKKKVDKTVTKYLQKSPNSTKADPWIMDEEKLKNKATELYKVIKST